MLCQHLVVVFGLVDGFCSWQQKFRLGISALGGGFMTLL